MAGLSRLGRAGAALDGAVEGRKARCGLWARRGERGSLWWHPGGLGLFAGCAIDSPIPTTVRSGAFAVHSQAGQLATRSSACRSFAADYWRALFSSTHLRRASNNCCRCSHARPAARTGSLRRHERPKATDPPDGELNTLPAPARLICSVRTPVGAGLRWPTHVLTVAAASSQHTPRRRPIIIQRPEAGGRGA